MTTRADDPEFRTRVDHSLAAFAEAKARSLSVLGPDLDHLTRAALDFVRGGKRLRPQFCHAGWLVAGGTPLDGHLVTAAASLEWLQGSALVHDDLMDGSDTRRGRPSIHRAFEQLHRDEDRAGDATGFGLSTAVLMGDLMLSWCDEMMTTAILDSPTMAPRVAAARHYLDLCKTEVVAGQFLDVAAQTKDRILVDEAMAIVRFKSAKYTVERPLHIGAALAGASPDLIEALSAVALPLGEAFQLRDDVLGVFGDPAVTGKPAGDDLREGKRTVLIARAYELTDAAGHEVLRERLGTSDGVGPVADLIRTCGALAAVEADITRLEEQADAAIDALGPQARTVLGPLALLATRRAS
ncbi:polyprenyl synthetase family protein [Aeromicrobium yanjiei]|uniref:Polyprenyl synthetase family protein n=1 Tax=Aeromicrobium yanjiei TaxID=2662028 RepID=A0A5Q2MMD3_9ACTN|nr:polyprenyl synthetase family protein [Aeromicrobium yanjiei]QGG41100.1 polyprenyl synthetase family protein [Aeromicrobium yanjiei]